MRDWTTVPPHPRSPATQRTSPETGKVTRQPLRVAIEEKATNPARGSRGRIPPDGRAAEEFGRVRAPDLASGPPQIDAPLDGTAIDLGELFGREPQVVQGTNAVVNL